MNEYMAIDSGGYLGTNKFSHIKLRWCLIEPVCQEIMGKTL